MALHALKEGVSMCVCDFNSSECVGPLLFCEATHFSLRHIGYVWQMFV
jgi:hypothetical protein